MTNSPTESPETADAQRNTNRGADQGSPSSPQQNPAKTRNKNSNYKWWHTNDFPMLVVTFCGVIAVVWYACLTRQQVGIIRGQLDVLQRTERPWVAPVSISFTVAGEFVDFSHTFTNYGHLPTTGLYADAIIKPTWIYLRKDFVEVCRIPLEKVSTDGKDFTVYPNGTWKAESVNMPTLINLQKRYRLSELRPQPHMLGCVTYLSPLDAKPHRTEYYAGITVKNGGVSVFAINTGYSD